MTITSDYAGGWTFHGIVTPKFRQWTPFNVATQSNSSVIRLTFYGTKSLVNTMGYLRVVYDTGELVESPWRKFYFSDRSIILDLNIPEEFLINAEVVSRTIEVKKELFRRYRRYNGLIQDESWQVGLETLNQPAIPTTILAALEENRLLSIGDTFILLPSQEP